MKWPSNSSKTAQSHPIPHCLLKSFPKSQHRLHHISPSNSELLSLINLLLFHRTHCLSFYEFLSGYKNEVTVTEDRCFFVFSSLLAAYLKFVKKIENGKISCPWHKMIEQCLLFSFHLYRSKMFRPLEANFPTITCDCDPSGIIPKYFMTFIITAVYSEWSQSPRSSRAKRCPLFSFIADELDPELCTENELESTVWWHLVLMFPRKMSDVRSSDRSICIYSSQLYGNLRGKPCIHEYCSSITMPHLKFRFLVCRRTCDEDGLLTACTAIHTYMD